MAGWINVRNTSVELDNVPYSAEWLDTFVTEGNATSPSVIKVSCFLDCQQISSGISLLVMPLLWTEIPAKLKNKEETMSSIYIS